MEGERSETSPKTNGRIFLFFFNFGVDVGRVTWLLVAGWLVVGVAR